MLLDENAVDSVGAAFPCPKHKLGIINVKTIPIIRLAIAFNLLFILCIF
jgi:hypothetical protein